MLARLKRKSSKYSRFVKPFIFVSFFLIIISLIVKAISPFYEFARQNNLNPAFISSMIFNSPPQLKESSGRTNILLLGIGGGSHEGPMLTDSMIFVSLDLKSKDVVMVSLPRDIWSPTLKERINNAYMEGEEVKKGGGFILSKSITEEIVGQPIHYAWLIDFSGFKHIIDLVGGININVEQSFDDYEYPIVGKENDECDGDKEFRCRYEHISFTKGITHMDGEQALKFVRSRHAQGDEGTDFARSKRQQKVLLALKDKVLKDLDWKDISKMKKLLQAFDRATDTDMNWSETITIVKYFASLNTDKIKRPVLDSGNEEKGQKGFFINPPIENFYGMWVLIPRKGEADFSEVGSYIKCWIEKAHCEIIP